MIKRFNNSLSNEQILNRWTDKTSTGILIGSTNYCLIIIGIAFTIIYILLGKYMKIRVGKRAEEYTENERQFDEEKI